MEQRREFEDASTIILRKKTADVLRMAALGVAAMLSKGTHEAPPVAESVRFALDLMALAKELDAK